MSIPTYREATEAEAHGYLAGYMRLPGAIETEHGLMIPDVEPQATGTCKHCHKPIHLDSEGYWIDPEADGDDGIWRDSCEDHRDSFTAEHEPETPLDTIKRLLGERDNTLAMPGQAQDIADQDFIDGVRAALGETS